MLYDEREAAGILARARAKRDPDRYEADRSRAFHWLCEAVVKAAMKAGYETEKLRDGSYVIKDLPFATVTLRCDDKEPRIEGMSGLNEPRVPAVRLADLPIEYDPIEGVFVGIEYDTYSHPNPGYPRLRRSAVSILAEVVTKMLDEQTAQRPAGFGRTARPR